MPRLLLVSNRLPVTVKTDGARVTVTASPGGLATGLRKPHEESGGLWLGWPGDVSRLTTRQRGGLERELRALRTVPLYLTAGEVRRYYEGYANGALWPLFHYLLDRVRLDHREWETYREVNEKFADLVAAHAEPDDLIWIHDYQLMLLPGLLRQRLPRARIGFFLHIPFPSSEVFRILPEREAILRGLLGADLVGFHTFAYVRHFATSLLRVLGVESDVDRVHYEGREVRLGVFPMGVDVEAFAEPGPAPSGKKEAASIPGRTEGLKVLLGIDRLDYTKGILHRLEAFERFLDRESSWRGRLKLIQVAVPSRTRVEAYQRFRERVDETIGRINGAHATADWVPIHYLYRSLPQRAIASLYRSADVMLVTPLRDGMNLVAKEFVAARTDEDGVLILSEFAGAASDLGEALVVNPYDIDGVAEAIGEALRMPAAERRSRMRALRASVLGHDVHRWARDFISGLEACSGGARQGRTSLSERGDVAEVIRSLLRAPNLLLVLDYDGTLVPFTQLPELAVPDSDVIDLLGALAARSRTTVHVVSGRQKETLEKWFGGLPIGLHAEHGLWTRPPGQTSWTAIREINSDWKAKVRPILQQFAAGTPGSLVEEKSASIAWHYRMADTEFGSLQAKELRLHLGELLQNLPVEVLRGEKVVEVRQHGINKGEIVPRIFGAMPKPFVFAAMGDDRTDEDLFAALPAGGFAIHVGPRPSQAAYRLSDSTAARAFLRALLEEPRASTRA
jgi:trehalose 6-phosphate synthase/phosphatase